MDDPSGALDAQTEAELQIELLRIWEQSTKSIEEAVYLADQVLLMDSIPRLPGLR